MTAYGCSARDWDLRLWENPDNGATLHGMRAIEAIRKPAVTVSPEATLQHAAQLMDTHAVGSLVVVRGDEVRGIVTDRDLVLRGVARALPSDARVDAVMTADVVTMDADDDLRGVLPRFASNAIRRVPLVRDGKLVGLLAVDDLLIDLIADLNDLARPITGEVIFGHREQSVPAVISI